MVRSAARCLALLATLAGGSVYADENALSVDAGGGLVAMSLPAPYASSGRAVGGTFSFWAGARYALSNHLEVSATLFYEPRASAAHRAVEIATPDGRFPGTLAHGVSRYGALVGGRIVRGMVWRLSAGLELGVSRRGYSGFQLISDTNETGSFDYGLDLPDASVLNLVVAPSGGLEWAFGDRWSVSVLPRVSFLIGAQHTVALNLPLLVSYSFYL